MKNIKLQLHSNSKVTDIDFNINKIICAGFTGRNQTLVLQHIHELEKLGINPPKSTPTSYILPNSLISTSNQISVSGNQNSGEAEAVILIDKNKWYVTIGSDHTDRKIEQVDFYKSKLVCPKIISNIVWDYGDVKNHWDNLIITSNVENQGKSVSYQEGKLLDILKIDNMLKLLNINETGIILFTGTFPTKQNLLFSHRFSMKIHDPKLNRSIEHFYNVKFN